MQPIDLLRELSDAFGVSGFEDEVREIIRARIAPFVDTVDVDALGNLVAVRKGKDDRVLMLDAHMDEVGFIVKWVDDKGYVRFAPLGGWDERIVGGHRVVLRTRDGRKRIGVIGSAPPHILSADERAKPIPMDKMFVDVGATSRQEASDLGVEIGDPFTIHYPFSEIADGYVTGKALDDRAGCAVLIDTARRLEKTKLPMTTAFTFVFGEELARHRGRGDDRRRHAGHRRGEPADAARPRPGAKRCRSVDRRVPEGRADAREARRSK